ncbi:hypothetical protein OTUT144_1819 [Orientia tsutsugamushi str. UT144]|uniref:D12 class N6 adenine-specific DNA methyltransferase family protein n=1 Tax=Orientia tsutsugamushi str. UT144 TaxID=1441384 RepID=A0A0F3RJG8_ORITS|nr:hypothetical protein OTUT144_1819 [Orientia tsutsugamushi str. UT144]
MANIRDIISTLFVFMEICGPYLSIYATDFSFIEPQQNDFVYFDPPYHKSGDLFILIHLIINLENGSILDFHLMK